MPSREQGAEGVQDPLPIPWPAINRVPDRSISFWTYFRAAFLTGPQVPNAVAAAWMAFLQALKWWDAGEIPAQILAYADADRHERARIPQPQWSQPPSS